MRNQYLLQILSKMYKSKTDAYDEHFYAYNFDFYDFWNEIEISKKDYEQAMLELKQSGYITIEPSSTLSYDGAIVRITKQGIIYANESK